MVPVLMTSGNICNYRKISNAVPVIELGAMSLELLPLVRSGIFFVFISFRRVELLTTVLPVLF